MKTIRYQGAIYQRIDAMPEHVLLHQVITCCEELERTAELARQHHAHLIDGDLHSIKETAARLAEELKDFEKALYK